MLVSRILTLALRAAGVSGAGQTPSSDMTQTAFDSLNAMIGQWADKRWLIYHLVDANTVSTGATSYTVGPSGAFNVAARPADIESAYVSMYYGTPRQIDTPLEQLKAREDYNSITMKGLVSFPQAFYYDNAFPAGLVYFWPIPNATQPYQLTITAKMPLVAFANTSLDPNLPPEYTEAIIYNLAARLRTMYQLPPEPAVIAIARAGLGTIRSGNAQIPRLSIPSGALRGGRFNVYSGQ